jgi:hypothetical protein
MKTTPFAVAGRCRATAIPAIATVVAREAGRAVVGEHLFPLGLWRKVGNGRGRLERERQLAVATSCVVRTRHDANPPEEVTARAEAVAGA